MRSFKEYLAKTSSKGSRVIDEKTIFFLFRKEVQNRYGERGVEMIQPFLFREQMIGIKTTSPLWANEVWLARNELIEAVNKAVGEEVVKSIKLYR